MTEKIIENYLKDAIETFHNYKRIVEFKEFLTAKKKRGEEKSHALEAPQEFAERQ